jgi:hypothetical protein
MNWIVIIWAFITSQTMRSFSLRHSFILVDDWPLWLYS